MVQWLTLNCLSLDGITVDANLISFQDTRSVGGMWEPLHPPVPVFNDSLDSPLGDFGFFV